MLRRGFKTEAERISAELRDKLGLSLHDRLECLELAAHLGIPADPVTVLADFGARDTSLARLIGPNGCLSAMTVYRGMRCRIFYNPHHSAARTANSVAHELAHVILEHQPRPLVGPDGELDTDPTQEAEADWQAAALLVPRDGALGWLARGGTMSSGATHFGVSVELFTWRANQTGVVRQLNYRTRAA